ncbi:MAG TPA: zinc ribbon domain-containing protein [Vicinamibacteria bacterium]|nr:zinc ribbon domain-containing protein [Vicinamibacteria bacterium]
MPLYEYECPTCGLFEAIRKFSDPPLEACPTCGQPVQKVLSAPAFQFKGTGWYITDYARKSDGKGKKDKGESKGEGKPEGKSEGKTEAAKPGAAASGSPSGGGTGGSDKS